MNLIVLFYFTKFLCDLNVLLIRINIIKFENFLSKQQLTNSNIYKRRMDIFSVSRHALLPRTSRKLYWLVILKANMVCVIFLVFYILNNNNNRFITFSEHSNPQ